MVKQLTPKQFKFAEEYFLSGNAYDAAVKAGYSKTTAKVQGKIILENVRIQKYLEEKKETLSIITKYTKQAHVQGLLEMIDTYKTIVSLSNKNDITIEEEMKLSRLNQVIKASDVIKIKDQLAKIFGLYEAEKFDIRHQIINVSFGEENKTIDITPNDNE